MFLKALRRIRRRFRCSRHIETIPLLPEFKGDMPTPKQVQDSFFAIKDSLAFKFFCGGINDRIRAEDNVLMFEKDRDKLLAATLRRQSLLELVDAYWLTLDYTAPTPEVGE